jgi:hypothetical protein
MGWCTAFAERVREIVLPGYTVFSNRDARTAARRMLTRGPIRLKKPLSASGKDQTAIATLDELDAALEKVGTDEMATYGLVLEENLRQVTTLSVGQVAVGSLTISYHGTQRTVTDNEGRPVYGGSDLMCVRGAGRLSIRCRCRPRHAPPWLQQGDMMRRRRSSTVLRHRVGTTMSLRESALTVGHDQGYSSLRGAWAAQAVPK